MHPLGRPLSSSHSQGMITTQRKPNQNAIHTKCMSAPRPARLKEARKAVISELSQLGKPRRENTTIKTGPRAERQGEAQRGLERPAGQDVQKLPLRQPDGPDGLTRSETRLWVSDSHMALITKHVPQPGKKKRGVWGDRKILISDRGRTLCVSIKV